MGRPNSSPPVVTRERREEEAAAKPQYLTHASGAGPASVCDSQKEAASGSMPEVGSRPILQFQKVRKLTIEGDGWMARGIEATGKKTYREQAEERCL